MGGWSFPSSVKAPATTAGSSISSAPNFAFCAHPPTRTTYSSQIQRRTVKHPTPRARKRNTLTELPPTLHPPHLAHQRSVQHAHEQRATGDEAASPQGTAVPSAEQLAKDSVDDCREREDGAEEVQKLRELQLALTTTFKLREPPQSLKASTAENARQPRVKRTWKGRREEPPGLPRAGRPRSGRGTKKASGRKGARTGAAERGARAALHARPRSKAPKCTAQLLVTVLTSP